MKTAKKLLALVLVIVMAVGLTTLAVAKDAAEYPDIGDVSDDAKVALYVLSAIGILDGRAEDGTFDPQGVFKRCEAAKIIAYLLMGPGAERLPPLDTGFKDVPATHWASKFIGYCVAQGVIMGYGDGNFGPEDPVTDIQFEAMLLRILGGSGYEGAGWEMRVFADATGGIANLLSFDLDVTKAALRENVAVYAFNALKYVKGGTVTTRTVFTVVALGATPDAKLLALEDAEFGSRSDALLTVNATGSYTYNVDYRIDEVKRESAPVGGFSLAEKFGLEKGLQTDPFGRPSTVAWYVGTKKIITEAGDDPVKFYTAAVTNAGIYKDLGLTSAKTATVTVDGAPKASVSLNATATATSLTDHTGNGVLTEVYKVGDSYSIVIINNFVAEVAKVNNATATAARSVNLRIYPLVTGGGTLYNNYETDDFELGDVVLVTKTGATTATIQSVKLAAIAEDTAVTNYATGTIPTVTFAGSRHNYAVAFNDNLGINDLYEFAGTYTFYLDENGYVVANEEYTAAAAAIKFVYVNASSVAPSSGTGTFATPAKAKVEVYYIDGTKEVVDLKVSTATAATGNGLTAGQSYIKLGTAYYGLATGNDDSAALMTALNNKVFAYTTDAKDDKLLTLSTDLGDGKTPETIGAVTTGEVTFAASKPQLTGLTGQVNSATQLLTVSASGAITTYSGFSKFPTGSTSSESVVYVRRGSVITNILVIGATFSAPPVADGYAVYTGSKRTSADGAEYELFVNGKLGWYLMEDEPDIAKVAAYTFFYDEAAEEAELDDETTALVGAITRIDDNYFTYGASGVSEIIASDCVVYDISSPVAAAWGVDDIAVGDTVIVMEATTGPTTQIVAIFITARAA